MSAAEKRYFRIFSGRHEIDGGNDYVKLYDFIESQKSYNESSVRRHFREEAFLKRLDRVKNRLYHNLLKSLVFFHSESSAEHELYYQLQSARILFAKRLMKQTVFMIKKAKKTAYRHDLLWQLPEVIQLEKQILSRSGLATDMEKSLNEEKDIVGKLLQINGGYRLQSQLFHLVNTLGLPRTLLIKRRYDNLFKKLTKAMKEDNRNLLYRYALNYTMFHYHYVSGNFAESFKYAERSMAYFRDDHLHSYTHVNNFMYSCNNFLVSIHLAGKYNKIPQALNQLKQMTVLKAIPGILPRSTLLINYYANQLVSYCSLGLFKEAIGLVPEIESEVKKIGFSEDKQMLYFLEINYAVTFFGGGDFISAKKWLYRIISRYSVNYRPDLDSFARMLSLMCDFELRNYTQLEYAIRNLHRYLLKKQALYEFEKEVLGFIRKIIYAVPASKALTEEFRKLKPKLMQISRYPEKIRVFEFFDFISWLESKLNGRRFEELVREKAVRNAKL